MLRKILYFVGTGFASLIALIFAFVEIRCLFAGDFTLMNNPASSFFGYLFRGLFYLGIIALAVTLIIFKIKNKDINEILFFASIGLFVGSFVTFAFYDYYVTLIVIFITLILGFITSINIFYFQRK